MVTSIKDQQFSSNLVPSLYQSLQLPLMMISSYWLNFVEDRLVRSVFTLIDCCKNFRVYWKICSLFDSLKFPVLNNCLIYVVVLACISGCQVCEESSSLCWKLFCWKNLCQWAMGAWYVELIDLFLSINSLIKLTFRVF